ncbi:hypothetical protein [Haloplanus halophilus]|uniref:hypothetical protein n=1 Tax=Haloplanus halophilus TaxID=2949993 RepID=UPI002040C499|nr:hypothetical protein [Haloplanus sp. GDY1]
MSLDIPAAIEDGLSRLPTRVAAILFVAYLVVGVLSTVASQTVGLAVMERLQAMLDPANAPPGGPGAMSGGASPLALDVGLAVAAVLFLAQIVVAQALGVVTIRTFVSSARREFPDSLSRRFGWVVVNALVAGFVVNVLIFVGGIFLIIPGIYLAVALYFVQFEVIVEDKNVVDALRDGWALTSGRRLHVFLLLLVIFAIGLASAVPAYLLGMVNAPALAVVAVSVVLGAVTGLVVAAIGSRAYVQLKPDGWAPAGEASPFDY